MTTEKHTTIEQPDGNLFAVVVLLLIGAALGSAWTLALQWVLH